MSPRDHQARTSEIGDPDPIPLSTREKARFVVAGHANDAQDCEQLWTMLGIHPSQDKDPEGIDLGATPSATFNRSTPKLRPGSRPVGRRAK